LTPLDITEKYAIELSIKALMDIVESGASNIQVSKLTFDSYRQFEDKEVEGLVESLEDEEA